MTTALKNRIARLEGNTTPPEHRNALVVLYGDCDPETLIGVYGINVPRLATETVDDFLWRLSEHVRATRGNALPFVGFAQYAGDKD